MTGEQLKQLREGRQWSQQMLAELLNGSLDRRYTSATISQWELGKRNVPAAVAAFVDQLALNDAFPPSTHDDPAAGETPPPPYDGDRAPGPEPPEPPAAAGQLALGPSGAYTRVCTELWEMVATAVGMLGAVVGNPQLVHDGLIIDADKAALGRAYGRLAETNETFRKMLMGATSSGVWLEVALVTGGTASKLWRNHVVEVVQGGTPHAEQDGSLAAVAG